MSVTSRSIKTYDKNAMPVDYAVRLLFLPEGKDTYSDMAVTYRDYLMQRGLTADVGEQDHRDCPVPLRAGKRAAVLTPTRTVDQPFGRPRWGGKTNTRT